MAVSSSAVTMSRYQDSVRRTAPAASSRIPVSQRRDETRHVSAPHRSRLLMMQESFQKKLMKEKEEKMLAIYQRQNEQGLQKVQRYNSQEGNSQGIVRDFFRERREMEQSQGSANVISRDTHFQQKLKAKRKASSLASDVESINSQTRELANTHPRDDQKRLEKNKEQEMQNYLTKQQRYQQQQTGKAAKGVVRSNPLAPIKRESMKNKTQNAPSSYDHYETSETFKDNGAYDDDADEDYNVKPLSKPQKVSRHLSKQKADFSDSSDDLHKGHLQGNHNRQPQQPKPINSRKVAPPIARTKSNQRKPQKEKPSDFQKWQQEQDLQRQERLKNHEENSKPKNDYTVDYDKELEQEMNSAKARRKKEYEDMMAKERELEDLIARHKKDLEKMDEDDSSDGESFTPRKPQHKAASKKASRVSSKLTADSYEDASYSPYNNDDYESRAAPKKASRMSSKLAEDPYEDASYSPYNNDDYESRAGEFKSRQRQALQTKPKAKPKPKSKVKEQEDSDPYKPPSPIHRDTSFYEQAGGEEEEMVDVDLEECPVCGRRFATDRLAKHAVVCKKASKKKRKVFDMTKQRTEGTEYAQYVKQGQHLKNEQKAKPSNWKRKHEEFIRSIRDARQTQAYVARGGNLADLPPPPPSENPDYKQCPYCERRFNPDTAARHIPKCKDIKSRPKPPRRK